MNFFKTLLVTLVAIFISGCYTQLQYSQKMKKITDEPKESKVYSWNGEEQAQNGARNKNGDVSEYAEEDSIPLYYKDYEYAERYNECGCDPYNVYNFYGNDWYGYDSYYSFHRPWAMSPFYYHSYHPYYYHHYPRFAFSFSWGWGSTFNYHRFYDPFFYDPFFDYYRYGYYRPFASSFYFYGNPGYGYGYFDSDDKRRNKHVRYGPRSIGTDRVGNDSHRSRDANVSGRSATVNTTRSTVRTRSAVGTTRTRSSSDRNTGSSVNRTRSQNSSGGTSRSRSRDNLQSNSNSDGNIDRTRDAQSRAVNDRNRSREIRSRTVNNNSVSNIWNSRSNLRSIELPKSRVKKSESNRRTFFNRMKSFFRSSTGRISNGRSSSRTIRSRSSSTAPSRSTVRRSNSSSSRSSVTRSRSSSSSSKSRGSSSSSRSRSSGGDSGGSDRSRDR